MFILHAEHEMNCSTAAARHLASSGVDVYTAMAGAVGALYGPLHGGANEAVLRMLERIGKVQTCCIIHLVSAHPCISDFLPSRFPKGGEHPGFHRRGQV
jgi:citrate synthase